MTKSDQFNLDHYLNNKLEPFWANVVYDQIQNFTTRNRQIFHHFTNPKCRKSTEWGYLTSLQMGCTCSIWDGKAFNDVDGVIKYKRRGKKHLIEFVTT